MEGSILSAALEVGFDLAAIAPLAPPPAADRFRAWLAAGHHADMTWLARNEERIADPSHVLPSGRSILVLGLGHSRPSVELPGGGRVARYAAGRDYHNIAGRMLRRLRKKLDALGVEGVGQGEARGIVDAGPILERSHAARAGLGFESKAANLLHPRFGPWFFLAELLVSTDLAPTATPPAGSCGTCTACLDACPTQAIVAPGTVDARRCISYHTIENKGPAPRDLRPDFGEWFFGCDVCSEVCPWGSDAPDLSERFGLHPAVGTGRLADWLSGTGPANPAEREGLHGSPLQRPGPDGRARNAAIALGNGADPDGSLGPLAEALDSHPTAFVREAAGWALARRDGGATTRHRLDRARAREDDAWARAELERTLDDIAPAG